MPLSLVLAKPKLTMSFAIVEVVSNDVKMANHVMTSKKATPSKHAVGKEEKRKAVS